MLRSIVALSDAGELVSIEQLPARVRDGTGGSHVPNPTVDRLDLAAGDAQPLIDTARHAIDAALGACANHVGDAARRLGVHRSTVYRHLARRRGA